jgi:hypothetical protein
MPFGAGLDIEKDVFAFRAFPSRRLYNYLLCFGEVGVDTPNGFGRNRQHCLVAMIQHEQKYQTPTTKCFSSSETADVRPAMRCEGNPSNGQSTDPHFRTYNPGRISSLWAWLSASSFPYRFRLLYGLLLELRSLFHRIQLLRRRGHSSQPRMGRVWTLVSSGQLVPNAETQSRTLDMQQIRDRYPWLSPEDWNLFLIGWDAGWESNVRVGTQGSSGQQQTGRA